VNFPAKQHWPTEGGAGRPFLGDLACPDLAELARLQLAEVACRR